MFAVTLVIFKKGFKYCNFYRRRCSNTSLCFVSACIMGLRCR